MIVRESSGTTHIENRWLVALAVLAVFLVLTLLSGRVKTFPVWVPCTLMVAFFGSELALRFATVKPARGSFRSLCFGSEDVVHWTATDVKRVLRLPAPGGHVERHPGRIL